MLRRMLLVFVSIAAMGYVAADQWDRRPRRIWFPRLHARLVARQIVRAIPELLTFDPRAYLKEQLRQLEDWLGRQKGPDEHSPLPDRIRLHRRRE